MGAGCIRWDTSDRAALAACLRRRLLWSGTIISAVACALVASYLLVVFPSESFDGSGDRILGFTASLIYTVAAAWYAISRAPTIHGAVVDWLRSGRPATDEDRRAVVRVPARGARLTFRLWILAVPIFSLPLLAWDVAFAKEVAGTIFLAALVTSAADYLAAERIVRPAVALALVESDAPPDAGSLGIGTRLILTWLLFSGVPLVMIALIPSGRQIDDPADLTLPIAFVAGIALVFGFLAMKVSTMAVSRPIRALRRAMDELGDGDTSVRVTVDDASEIGRLQVGFNQMVAGLKERELLRDLYGRQVGDDVAREALERGGADLGGQERVVTALFVDVIGSTALAHRESPARVVALLNDFFAIVVEAVHRHGGLVNKFEGDAALCVFGAPADQPDHAARALACARELRTRLDALDGGFDAAIGIACGPVVAGYVGAVDRFEYTVIGDPVNEASRLTELAKQHSCRLLAAWTVVDSAGGAEAAYWQRDGQIVLRGRTAPTRLAVLAGTEPGVDEPAGLSVPA